MNKITGKAEGRNYKVEEVKDFKTEDADLSEALKAAMKNRPELLRCQSAARAAQVDLDAKRKGNWPRISTSAAHQVSDTDIKGDDTTRSWNAGVAVKWPWFDGFKTRSEIEAAQANLKIAQASIQDETLNIALEVENAVLSLEESKERIGTTEKFLQEATENLEIANARYEEDLGSTIEVTDAETYLVSAKKSHASAIADYLSSVADYQKSIGVISQGMKNF